MTRGQAKSRVAGPSMPLGGPQARPKAGHDTGAGKVAGGRPKHALGRAAGTARGAGHDTGAGKVVGGRPKHALGRAAGTARGAGHDTGAGKVAGGRAKHALGRAAGTARGAGHDTGAKSCVCDVHPIALAVVVFVVARNVKAMHSR
jgi:hypothetical protein